MLGAAWVAAAAAAVASPPSPAIVAGDTIVVTGIRLEELRAAETKCAQNGCGIRDDIIAAVRYADALFYSGRYEDAARVLAHSVARNRGRAADDPRAMSELYVAQATVAKHYGDPIRQSIALQGSARILKDSYAANDSGVQVSQLDVGDMFMGRGDARYAQARFEAVATQARAAGQTVTARSAELHSAWLLVRRGRVKQAIAQLQALSALPGDDMRDVRLAARILEFRLARSLKDEVAMARLRTAMAAEPASTPLPLWEPPLPSPSDTIPSGRFTGVGSDPATSVTLRWADIEFEIAPDGKVKGVEVVRGPGDHDWVAPVVKVIGERLYTPVAATADAAAVIRKERYTLTATFEKPKTSNIPRRMLDARYERLDLSQPLPPPPTPATALN